MSVQPYDHAVVSDALFAGVSGPPLPKTDREHPVEFQLGAEFGGASGAGLYLNCSSRGPALLVLPAGTDSLASRAALWTRWGTELRCDVLLVDYPGVGAGVGPASLSAAREVARAALRYLILRPVEEVPGVVILGRGVGAALAVDTLLDVMSDRVRGLVLETGPADLATAFGAQVDWASHPDPGAAREALRRDFDLRAGLGRLTCPLLVLHPQQQPAIAFDHGERLAQWGGGELVILARGDRDDVMGLNEAEYRRALTKFFAAHARFEDDPS